MQKELTLLEKVKEAIRLSDIVGQSRGSNCYALNKGAVARLVTLEIGLEAEIKTLLDAKDAEIAALKGAALRIAAKRESDEPFFTLLGRDPQAPALVRQWADERQRLDPSSNKPGTARFIAASMEFFKKAHPSLGLVAQAVTSAPTPLLLELDDAQALALAQFCKRIGWAEVRQNAIDDEEAYLMLGTLSLLQLTLARAGFAPR